MLITQLGIFDDGGDGLVNSHQVGLWHLDDNVSGPLLASAVVPAGTAAPLIGGYRFVPITPVVIPYTGHSLGYFVVAAQYSAGDADDLVRPQPTHFASELGVVTSYGRKGDGSDLPFPQAVTGPSCEGCGNAERFWEPNLQYTVVPEPSVWLLLSPALVYLFIRHRKVRRLRQNRSIERRNALGTYL